MLIDFSVKQFRTKCNNEGPDITLLESRLENELEMNFIIFGHENDRKRRKIEVSYGFSFCTLDNNMTD